MNENINLVKILENCPEGTELYTTAFGYVKFKMIIPQSPYPIKVNYKEVINSFTADGKMMKDCNAECTLFPSKNQRDWSEFTAPWYKKVKFDPKALKQYDKVLIRDNCAQNWRCDFFSHIIDRDYDFKYVSIASTNKYCIPYNDNTKHLVGTTDEAPNYYRYWEEMKNI